MHPYSRVEYILQSRRSETRLATTASSEWLAAFARQEAARSKANLIGTADDARPEAKWLRPAPRTVNKGRLLGAVVQPSVCRMSHNSPGGKATMLSAFRGFPSPVVVLDIPGTRSVKEYYCFLLWGVFSLKAAPRKLYLGDKSARIILLRSRMQFTFATCAIYFIRACHSSEQMRLSITWLSEVRVGVAYCKAHSWPSRSPEAVPPALWSDQELTHTFGLNGRSSNHIRPIPDAGSVPPSSFKGSWA